MKVLIIGAAGIFGAELADRLATDGKLGGENVGATHLVDNVEPRMLVDWCVPEEGGIADLSESGAAERLIAARPDVIFHLAVIVSASRRHLTASRSDRVGT